MLLRAGDRVDRYTLVKPLGEGGQGSVWKVIDPLDGGRVRALKIVELEHPDAPASERARREANALARVKHPALVACHGVYEDPESRYVALVLDLVQGAPLVEVLRDPRMSAGHRYAVLAQVAEALERIHAEGLVHRDLKPENILITDGFWESPGRAGGVKIIDFGIVARQGNPRPLTATGGFIGTTPYLPPEIVDPASFGPSPEGFARDLFAFGVIAWVVLSGGHPTGLSSGATVVDYARFYKAAEAGRVAWPPGGLQGPWAVAIGGCLALRPRDRPVSGAALMHILRTGIDPLSATTRASSPALSALTAPRAASARTAMTAIPRERDSPPPPLPMRSPGWGWMVLVFILAMGATAWLTIESGWFTKKDDAPAPTIPTVFQTSVAPVLTAAPATPPPAREVPCCGGVDCPASRRDVKGSSCENAEVYCATCSSKRTYIEGACRDALKGSFQLRLAGVLVGREALREGFVRVSTVAPPQREVAMFIAGAADQPHPDPTLVARLPINITDLLQEGGINIEVWSGNTLIASQRRAFKPPPLRTTVLCRGLVFGIEPATSVLFYLEDDIPR